MAALAALQSGLLASGFRMLAPGGRLVYSTCSLTVAYEGATHSDVRQNEDIVASLLDSEPSARALPVVLPGAPTVVSGTCLRVGPSKTADISSLILSTPAPAGCSSPRSRSWPPHPCPQSNALIMELMHIHRLHMRVETMPAKREPMRSNCWGRRVDQNSGDGREVAGSDWRGGGVWGGWRRRRRFESMLSYLITYDSPRTEKVIIVISTTNSRTKRS
jgi:hypothetical protein